MHSGEDGGTATESIRDQTKTTEDLLKVHQNRGRWYYSLVGHGLISA